MDKTLWTLETGKGPSQQGCPGTHQADSALSLVLRDELWCGETRRRVFQVDVMTGAKKQRG